MLVNQAYKFRIWPTEVQEKLFRQHCGLARFAYNWHLARRDAWWERNKDVPKDQRDKVKDPEPNQYASSLLWTETHAERVDEHGTPWAHKVLERSTVSYALAAVDDGFKHYFRRRKTNEVRKCGACKRYEQERGHGHPPCKHCYGYPQYKAKGAARDSFTVQDQKFTWTRWSLNIGTKIREVSTRPIDQRVIDHARMQRGKTRVGNPTDRLEGKVLRINISRQADRWIATIMVAREREDPVIDPNLPVAGIDLGVTNVATVAVSSTTIVGELGSGTALARKLKRLQRLSRRLDRRKEETPRYKEASKALAKLTKGSQEYAAAREALRGIRRHSLGFEETKTEIAKLHAQVTDLRQENLHRISTALTKNTSRIIVDGYDLRELVSGRKSAKPAKDGELAKPGQRKVRTRTQRRKFADNAAGELRRQIQYKGQWYGSRVDVLAKHSPTNRTCSACMHVHEPDERRDRASTFICVACSHTLPRRFNTAVLLRRIGQGEVDAP